MAGGEGSIETSRIRVCDDLAVLVLSFLAVVICFGVYYGECCIVRGLFAAQDARYMLLGMFAGACFHSAFGRFCWEIIS